MDIGGERFRIPFRAVNRRGAPDYDAGLQRHHLLPRQLLSTTCFTRLFDTLRIGNAPFDDFRRNGILLPCHETSAIRLGLPLHRGPHRHYNELVIERVGQIEAGWEVARMQSPDAAGHDALMRLALLQRGLRRYLMDTRRKGLKLNRFDPRGPAVDFTELDAIADAVWGATEPVVFSEMSEADQPRSGDRRAPSSFLAA